jgi:hypothetical protein
MIVTMSDVYYVGKNAMVMTATSIYYIYLLQEMMMMIMIAINIVTCPGFRD